ncbi:MAG: retroviral-like aspartic protease family protein [Stellaceae bacterium]
MRRLLIAALLALSFAAPALAASLSADQIVAIDKAADAFLAKAVEAKKTGMVPRQSDPAVAALLDTVFDTGALNHGTIDYADQKNLIHWLTRLTAVGGVYVKAAHAAHDTGLFAAEIGRFFDASVAVLQAMIDSQVAELAAHPEVKLSAADQQGLAKMRAETATAVGTLIDLMMGPGVTTIWVHDRAAALTAAAPSLGRFLTTEQLAHLRATVIQLGARMHDKPTRRALDGLAVALAEPAPLVASVDAAPGGSEIALQADEAGGYTVAVQVNGALTANFLVDSGASLVALPKDMVDDLTKSGAIQPSDMQGRSVYVAADGKHHKSVNFMLRHLEVAGHVATNVAAGEVPAHSQPLLGLSFLTKFKSWTLDNERHVLILGE